MAAMPGCALDGARRIPSRVMAIIRSRSSSEPSRRNARSASRRTKRDARSTMALLAKNPILTPDAEQNAGCHNRRTDHRPKPTGPVCYRGVPPGRVRRPARRSLPSSVALLAPPVAIISRVPSSSIAACSSERTPDRAHRRVVHDMHHLLPRIVEACALQCARGVALAPIIPIDKQLETGAPWTGPCS